MQDTDICPYYEKTSRRNWRPAPLNYSICSKDLFCEVVRRSTVRSGQRSVQLCSLAGLRRIYGWRRGVIFHGGAPADGRTRKSEYMTLSQLAVNKAWKSFCACWQRSQSGQYSITNNHALSWGKSSARSITIMTN